MKNILLFGFLFLSIGMYSQANQSSSNLNCHLDSLDMWNYNILPIDKEEKAREKNPISKIVFFRTAAIKDTLQKNTGLRPAIIFYVYPVAMYPKVKEMAKRVSLTSSCQPPDRGGLYYVLKNFILLNYTSCTLCSTTSEKNIDLCKGNIERIVNTVINKDYKSFDQLCKDLPIKKGKY